MAEIRRSCKLCHLEAVVYCPSDSAFLCRECDEKVHNANFLVARHVRVHVGPWCLESIKVVDEVEEDCISSSSSCVSSTGEAEEAEVTTTTSSSSALSRRKRIYRRVPMSLGTKVEGVLVNWCRSMGGEDGRVVNTAIELLSGRLGRMTVLPFRVSLAAAFWVAIKLCSGTTTCHELRRLEQISGVPAKLIVATEPRITVRVFKRRQPREDHEEGWAEC